MKNVFLLLAVVAISASAFAAKPSVKCSKSCGDGQSATCTIRSVGDEVVCECSCS